MYIDYEKNIIFTNIYYIDIYETIWQHVGKLKGECKYERLERGGYDEEQN